MVASNLQTPSALLNSPLCRPKVYSMVIVEVVMIVIVVGEEPRRHSSV